MNKEDPVRFSVAIDLQKDNKNVWEKTRNCGMQCQRREELVSRKNRGKKSHTWNKSVRWEKDRPKNWEEVPNGRE